MLEISKTFYIVYLQIKIIMTNCENLHTHIVNLYGEDYLKETWIVEKLRVKMLKRVVDLNFYPSLFSIISV